jgi:hypothetical protein
MNVLSLQARSTNELKVELRAVEQSKAGYRKKSIHYPSCSFSKCAATLGEAHNVPR